MQMHPKFRWSGEAVLMSHDCLLLETSILLPRFRRARLSTSLGLRSRVRWFGGAGTAPPHRYLDAIVRIGDSHLAADVPIAVVSRNYGFTPHIEVVETLTRALDQALPNSDAGTLRTSLALSEYGGRMWLRVVLPTEYPGPDGLPLVATLECWNSVDGSCPLQVNLAWLRLVCSNGLVLSETFSQRRRHVRSLALCDFEGEVTSALQAITAHHAQFQSWGTIAVPAPVRDQWIDDVIADQWGPLNARRLAAILRTGCDVAPRQDGAVYDVRPSRARLARGAAVPGSEPPNETVYRAAQALSWLAGQRREIEAGQRRVAAIPQLVAPLIRAAANYS